MGKFLNSSETKQNWVCWFQPIAPPPPTAASLAALPPSHLERGSKQEGNLTNFCCLWSLKCCDPNPWKSSHSALWSTARQRTVDRHALLGAHFSQCLTIQYMVRVARFRNVLVTFKCIQNCVHNASESELGVGWGVVLYCKLLSLTIINYQDLAFVDFHVGAFLQCLLGMVVPQKWVIWKHAKKF